MPRVAVPVTNAATTAAALTTALTGSDNDLVFTAKAGGSWGNAIQVAYIDPGGVSADPSVVVEGFLITVNLGRAASAINTTAARVQSLVESNVDASKLVSVANAGSNDGSGLVTAMTATALTGGTYSVLQPSLVNGDATNDHYFTGNDGRVVVEAVSSDAGAQTVTVLRAASFVPGATQSDEVVSVAAGATRVLGPFPADEFNQNAAGDVYFNPSVSNTLDFRAYRVTRVQ